MGLFKKENHQGPYSFLTHCFESLGLKHVEERFSKMFTYDYLLANFDRHYGNFGAIRNVETLEFTRFAPIIDSGSCLWCNKSVLQTPADFMYLARPFAQIRADGRITQPPEKLLQKLSDFDWFSLDKLEGFIDEATLILEKNPGLPNGRSEMVRIGMEIQLNKAVDLIERARDSQRSPFADLERGEAVCSALRPAAAAVSRADRPSKMTGEAR